MFKTRFPVWLFWFQSSAENRVHYNTNDELTICPTNWLTTQHQRYLDTASKVFRHSVSSIFSLCTGSGTLSNAVLPIWRQMLTRLQYVKSPTGRNLAEIVWSIFNVNMLSSYLLRGTEENPEKRQLRSSSVWDKKKYFFNTKRKHVCCTIKSSFGD